MQRPPLAVTAGEATPAEQKESMAAADTHIITRVMFVFHNA